MESTHDVSMGHHAASVNNGPYHDDAARDQRSETPPSQHRRGYQACDPCRKRKVKCDLGSALCPSVASLINANAESSIEQVSIIRDRRRV
jgi:Fungal Zn(2)-Cys(6) binuclear cluster domain